MLYLLGLQDCKVCEESKKMLNDNHIKFEFKDLSDKNNLEIAKRFSVKVAGKYLYDDNEDMVYSVYEYINNLENKT